MKYIHLMRREKFTEGYISFIDERFDASQHVFFLIGGVKSLPVSFSKKRAIIDIQTPFKLLLLVPKFIFLGVLSNKIFVHGFSQSYQLIFFVCQPWLIKKMYWVVWGADLYSLISKQESFTKSVFNFIKKYLIKRCAGIVSLVPGDYDIAKTITNTNATYYNCLMYPTSVALPNKPKKINKSNNSLVIMVGNSASVENEHFFVFDKIRNALKKTNHYEITILVPLSYGDPGYAEKVITQGRAIFGDKFSPITSMLDKESYFNLLDKVDIAIFGFQRQQAMANILSLLALGKKIYIRTDITPWPFLKNKGFDIFDIEKIDLNLDLNCTKNYELINREFSINKSAEQWLQVFEAK